MAALAVDQHQQVIRRQTPQRGRAHQGRFVVNTVPLDIVRRGQGAQHVVHIDRCLRAQLVGIQHIYGRGRVLFRAWSVARPHDDGFFHQIDVLGIDLLLVLVLVLRLLGPRCLPDDERTDENETQGRRPQQAH